MVLVESLVALLTAVPATLLPITTIGTGGAVLLFGTGLISGLGSGLGSAISSWLFNLYLVHSHLVHMLNNTTAII
jgi:hypothetical protein